MGYIGQKMGGTSKFGNGTKNLKFYRNRDRIPRKQVHKNNSTVSLSYKGKEPTLLSLAKSGYLTGEFHPSELAITMHSKYYYNSANYLQQEDVDKLINSPKVFVEKYKNGEKLVDLSLKFTNANTSNTKKPRTYCSRKTEYYASVIDEKVQFFAVTYTSLCGINSISLSYLPCGKVEDAIFLARVCVHPTQHQNKMNREIIPGKTVHLHKVSQEYYNYILNRKKGKSTKDIAKAFVEADAEKVQFVEGQSHNVNDVGKELFSLKRHKKINIIQSHSMIEDMKNGIERELRK